MSLRSQLIGTWKSDRKRTLEGLAPYHRQKDPAKRRRISGLFGKLEVKYTRQYAYSTLKGSVERSRYEIIDESEDALIMKCDDTFPDQFDVFNGPSFYVIEFHETRYHKYMSLYTSRWNYIEWFRKIETS